MSNPQKKSTTLLAEENVIGAMLQSPQALHEARETLAENYFLHRPLAILYSEICAAEGEVDEITLRNTIEAKGKAAQIGGLDRIGRLIEGCQHPANIGQYCRIVEQEYKKRQAQNVADKIKTGQIDADSAAGELRQIGYDNTEQTLDGLLDDAMAGRRYSAPMPWEQIAYDVRALLPGTVTILGGSPGSTKSLAMLQAARYWTEKNIKTAVLEMEDGTAYHLRRALAQVAKCSDLTDDEYCRQNPAIVETCKHDHADAIAAMAGVIDSPQKTTCQALIGWVQAKADDGCRIICLDPVTAMQYGKEPWKDDDVFLKSVKRIVERYKASLFLITHPRKAPAGAKVKPSMDDLAGGVVYSRFCQTVLFLGAHDRKPAIVRDQHGTIEREINRTMVVFKARNGRGAEGREYGLWFEVKSLELFEMGRIDE